MVSIMNVITKERDWPSYNLAQTSEKLLFLKILNDAVNSLGIPKVYVGRGRPRLDADEMIKCCCIKVFNGFSSRRTIPDLHMAKEMGYISQVPHFNSIINYLNNPKLIPWLNVLYKVLASPMIPIENHFAVDSTGFGRYNTVWLASKNKEDKEVSFAKLHISTGVVTNIIASARITTAFVHDVLEFDRLVKDTKKNFDIEAVSADKGYLSFYNCNAVEEIGAKPYIMFKKNQCLTSNPKPQFGAWNRMLQLWIENREAFERYYHLRSNVESTFSSMKRKFLPYVRSKKQISQINEILCKVVCHNASVLVMSLFELGIKIDFENDKVKDIIYAER